MSSTPTRLPVTKYIIYMCAKSKSFFGLRRGSTKSLTFQVLDGTQITKDRVTEVRNPRTEKQRIQRVIMNTALRAYSHMQEIVNHSFEGVTYGGKTQQAFIADNIREVRNRLADKGESYKYEKSFTPIGQTFVAPNAYIVSKGSLPEQMYSIGQGLIVPAGATYADLIAACKAEPGDQLTVAVLAGDTKPQNTVFRFCRIILQPQDPSGANLPLSTEIIADGHINMPNLKNENTDVFAFALVDGQMIVTVDGLTILAGATILSREVYGKWLRSPQKMAYASPKIGFNLIEAVATSVSEIAVTDPYYLNNAGAGSVTASAAVSSVKYNNEVLAAGSTHAAGAGLKIAGSKLGDANIVLFNGEQQYVQSSASDTEVNYWLSNAGQYRLYVNGDLYMQFTLTAPAAAAKFSAVKWDNAALTNGSNINAQKGSVTQLRMNVESGVSTGDVKASNSSIVISGAGISGGVYTANVTVNGNGTITCDGAVVVAITAVESDDQPNFG